MLWRISRGVLGALRRPASFDRASQSLSPARRIRLVARDQARRMQNPRPEAARARQVVDPSWREFHRQVAEDRGGRSQLARRERPDRRRSGRVPMGRATSGRYAPRSAARRLASSPSTSWPSTARTSASARSRSGAIGSRGSLPPAPTASCSVKPWRPRARSSSPRPAPSVWRGSCRSASVAYIGEETAGSG